MNIFLWYLFRAPKERLFADALDFTLGHELVEHEKLAFGHHAWASMRYAGTKWRSSKGSKWRSSKGTKWRSSKGSKWRSSKGTKWRSSKGTKWRSSKGTKGGGGGGLNLRVQKTVR